MKKWKNGWKILSEGDVFLNPLDFYFQFYMLEIDY